MGKGAPPHWTWGAGGRAGACTGEWGRGHTEGGGIWGPGPGPGPEPGPTTGPSPGIVPGLRQCPRHCLRCAVPKAVPSFSSRHAVPAEGEGDGGPSASSPSRISGPGGPATASTSPGGAWGPFLPLTHASSGQEALACRDTPSRRRGGCCRSALPGRGSLADAGGCGKRELFS